MEIKLSYLEEYEQICEKVNPSYYKYYRGQRDSTWDVQSTLYRFIRDNNIEGHPINVQKEFLRKFEKKRVENNLQSEIFNHVGTNHSYGIWHSLSQAQHIGIPTPLIDFTTDETFALRFALEETVEDGHDASVFIYSAAGEREDDIIFSDNHNIISPFDTEQYHLVNLPYQYDALESTGEKNKFEQKGYFVIQPYKSLDVALNKVDSLKGRFCKIIIPKECKKQMREELKSKHFPGTNFNNNEMYAQSEKLAKIVEEVRTSFSVI